MTKAWPINRGRVGVRVRNGAGGWFACIAPALGGMPERFDSIPPGTRPLPGEDTSPAPQSPPAGACYRHGHVLRADGEPLGLLSQATC